MAAIIIFAVLALSRTIVAIQWTPVIQTTKGAVVGEILQTADKHVNYASFKGIPYANPPIGYQRFKPPVEKTCWSGNLQAISEGSICTQIDFITNKMRGSEDCLYLNVYTPETQFTHARGLNLKPVMVWFHGGKFLNGYGNSSIYGPDFIVQEGVVLVTLNYRLGALGFLNVEHKNATGNAGLKDQNMALQWVHKNIIHFGGNPNKVTIFGQSAGAVSVDYHVLSDMSRGLFQQSISMSGSSLSPWGFVKPEHAVKEAFNLGVKLGLNTTDKDRLLKHLYKSSPEDIMKASSDMSLIFPAFRPSIENKTIAPNEKKMITECAKAQYKSGTYNKGPHIMGFLEHEGISYSTDVNEIQRMNSTESIIDTTMLDPVFVRIVLAKLANLRKNWTPEVVRSLLSTITDVFFASGIDEKQKLLNLKNNNPVYYYRTSVDPKTSLHRYYYKIDMDGASHGDDILYLFYIHFGNMTKQADVKANTARKRMVTMWTNFAKHGNPTPCKGKDCPRDIPTWPPSGKEGKYMDIGDKLSIVEKRPTSARIVSFQSLGVGIAVC